MLVGESAAGLEVAGGQALEVEAGEQPALDPGTPLPPTDNLGAESLHPIRKIADPRLADLHRTHADTDGPGGEVAVAIAAEVAAALVAGPPQELVDLGAESGMEHPLSAFPDQLLDQVVGGRDRCSRGQNLLPCRHGVASRSTRWYGSLVVDSNLEGYAVLVPSLAGASAAISTGQTEVYHRRTAGRRGLASLKRSQPSWTRRSGRRPARRIGGLAPRGRGGGVPTAHRGSKRRLASSWGPRSVGIS
jgi:hypothetical protein